MTGAVHVVAAVAALALLPSCAPPRRVPMARGEILNAGSPEVQACLARRDAQRGAPIPAPRTYVNSVGMELRLIPAGAFLMGTDQRDERARWLALFPLRCVELTRPFYIGRYRVTQEQWFAVMGTNPVPENHLDDRSWMPKGTVVARRGRKKPVMHIRVDDAREFVRRLNAKENTDRYRLPTEAEWEYAAKGGAWGDREAIDRDVRECPADERNAPRDVDEPPAPVPGLDPASAAHPFALRGIGADNRVGEEPCQDATEPQDGDRPWQVYAYRAPVKDPVAPPRHDEFSLGTEKWVKTKNRDCSVVLSGLGTEREWVLLRVVRDVD